MNLCTRNKPFGIYSKRSRNIPVAGNNNPFDHVWKINIFHLRKMSIDSATTVLYA